MGRRLLLPALAGWFAIMIWIFISNGLFSLNARATMRTVTDEPALYAALQAAVPAPGGYTVNPPLTAEGRFPRDAPVFSVSTSGLDHGDAGRLMLSSLVTGLLACLLAAWLLAVAAVGGGFGRRVLVVAALGLFVVLVADLPRYGIGGYPLGGTLLLALQQLLAWTLAGLAMAAATRSRGARTSSA